MERRVFGVPDQVDRYRTVTFGKPTGGKKGDPRPLQEPGTYWEYNDVRINQLSLALLHLFGRPLPEVFREAIMRPVGASENWRWVGYDNAWIEIAGTAGAVGSRRHPLGRRHVDRQRRPGPGRPTDAGRWQGERPAGALGRLDTPHAHALRDRALLRLSGLAESRAQYSPACRRRATSRSAPAARLPGSSRSAAWCWWCAG